MQLPTIAEVLSPAFLERAVGLPMAELRQAREAVTVAETGLSYLRRLVQGRLDIVLAEQARRSAGRERGDLSDLIEQLPSILAGHIHSPGSVRLAPLLAPGSPDPELAAEVEAALPADRLALLVELSDSELESAAASLRELERSLSERRHAVHAVIDRLQEEVVRRYQSGEATLDGLVQ